MKICLVTFYYPPDLCAGSFRSEALVDALLKYDNKISKIEIFTSIPNRYSSHKIENKQQLLSKKISINRIFVPSHNSSVLGQALAFLFFGVGVLWKSRNKDWDIIICTSSRLMTAFLGALISKNKKRPLYLDIRDLFVDTMKNILIKNKLKYLIFIFKIIEKWTFNSANKINIVSFGFKDYMCNIVKNKKMTFYTNGIDDVFLNGLKNKRKNSFPKKINILYAGNIGSGQALNLIIPKAAIALKNEVVFTIIGDGGKRLELENLLKKFNIKNVKLISPVARDKLIPYYENADILFLHLNNFPAFEKVLPSKIFEYAAINKPILAGVAGYASYFIKKEVSNSEVFDPCDHHSLVRSFKKIVRNKKKINRNSFINKFKRKKLMKLMAKDILELTKNV